MANDNGAPRILVVEDVEETRDGIEKLLTADGYRVDPARDEAEAVARARRTPPDLILISFRGRPIDVIAMASRVRKGAHVGQRVPVVIFCIQLVLEGAEVEIEGNVHLTRPDNFDQLRALIQRLLHDPAPTR